MKLYSILVAILLLALQPPAKACLAQPCDLAEIAEQLQQQPALNSFKQEKQVKVLSTPLESKGYLLLSDEQGLVWQTTKPIKSTAVITPSSFQQFNKKDQPISLGANNNNATSELISSTFVTILSGKLTELEKNFKIESACIKGKWDINLTPHNSDIGKVLTHIHIHGTDRIQRLDFEEANGDITRLFFTPENDNSIKQQLGKYLER